MNRYFYNTFFFNLFLSSDHFYTEFKMTENLDKYLLEKKSEKRSEDINIINSK